MKNFHVTMKDVTPAGMARGLEQIQKVSDLSMLCLVANSVESHVDQHY